MPSTSEMLRWIGHLPATRPDMSLVSARADKIRETLSARNRQVFAALARDMFDAFGSGRTIKQLCQEFGLPERRVRDILKDEKARSRYRR